MTGRETESQRAVVEPEFRSVSKVCPIWAHLNEKPMVVRAHV